MMGDEPRRRPDNGRDRGRERHRSHSGASSTQKKTADPIFSKPYEPASAPKPESAAKPEPQQSSNKRRQPQVAALLGGLKRA
jgi:hypothetical protein